MKIYINKKKWLSIGGILLVFLLTFFLNGFSSVSYAFTQTTGTIVTSSGAKVNVRAEASTTSQKVCQLNSGTSVTVVDEAAGGDGYTWYQIQFFYNNTTTSGFVRSDCISIAAASVGDTSAYYAALQAKGFPDSYCSGLATLMAQYPTWDFEPVQTGLDFNTAVASESQVGKNLIQSSSNDARKSFDSSAYDWTNNTWYGYDGASWVAASSDYIAYCMDPRNFFDATNIFQFESLNYQSYQDVAGAQNILNNTFMAGDYTDTDAATRNYPSDFVSIGGGLGVSPYHLAARCKQEQGTNGTSQLISGSYAGYEGYFNYFNVGAYTTSSASSVENGLIYARNAGWNTRYKAITGGSQILYNKYVAIGQNTLYFQKFNVVYTPSLYSHQYMTNVQAAITEGASMSAAYSDKSKAFVFYIPVYNNMTASATGFSDAGNRNNWLSNLSVTGYAITPSFQGGVTDYSLIVGQNVGSVTVEAAPVAGTSSVSGTGNYSLNYGANTVTVNCTSQSGETKAYTISIVRQQSAQSVVPVDDTASVETNYKFDTYMTGITVGETADGLLAKITAKNCTVAVTNADGTANTGVVATGNKLVISKDGNVTKEYEIVVYGDLNGDGTISNSDLVLMKKHILGVSSLEGAYLAAADLNKAGDGVTNRDLVLLKKHILSIEALSQ